MKIVENDLPNPWLDISHKVSSNNKSSGSCGFTLPPFPIHWWNFVFCACPIQCITFRPLAVN